MWHANFTMFREEKFGDVKDLSNPHFWVRGLIAFKRLAPAVNLWKRKTRPSEISQPPVRITKIPNPPRPDYQMNFERAAKGFLLRGVNVMGLLLVMYYPEGRSRLSLQIIRTPIRTFLANIKGVHGLASG
jgi:hypothetical protein